MTWHVVCLAGPDDNFTPRLKPDDQVVTVPFNIEEHPDSFTTTVPDVLARYGIAIPTPASDFLNSAIGAYTADVRIPRRQGFDDWTRDIALHLSVQDMAGWDQGVGIFQQMLRFLTGDHWTIEVRRAPQSYEQPRGRAPREVRTIETDTACLFSGGLDSFIGALDLLEDVGRVALVGHHSAGAGATSRSQNNAIEVLREKYGEDLTPFLHFWVTPPKGVSRRSEPTTRGRSILFLALGVAVASGLGAGRLVVPENGPISLNIPLTNSRLGSFSTRTTHPYLMALLREFLTTIGIDIEVELPYRFLTKGEMIRQCKNLRLLKRSVASTMSCAHPQANRFAKKNPNLHCGYCVPCIIRRAAIRAVMSDPTDYAYEDLSEPLGGKRGSDFRAYKMALDRYRRKAPRLSDVLVAGPLQGSDAELREYLSVFNRGLDEVRRFLRRY
jgi:hypothetical protein